jgi:hypothetical protein
MVPEARRGVGALAGSVVAAELTVVGLLAVPATIPVGFVLAAGVLLAFSVGIARVLRAGGSAPCRCFGPSAAPLGVRHLVRNGVLVTVALAGLAADRLGGGGGALHPAGVALGVVAAGTLAFLVVFFDDLTDLFAPAPPRPATRTAPPPR